jgi:hypothetical protein
VLGRVIGVRWYPVKSMQGEDLAASSFTASGIPGDRHWGVLDVATGIVLSAKREPRLLQAWATVREGQAWITLPDGSALAGDDPKVDAVLSAWLDRDVRLVAASPGDRGTFEIGASFEDDSSSAVHQWQGPEGTFHDSRPVHLLSNASLRAILADHPNGLFDIHRFRPNFVVDVEGSGFVEERWIGATLAIGSARFEVIKPTSRCVMTTRPQIGLPRDLEILRTINRVNDGNLGVQVHVVGEGSVAVGDTIELVTA